MVTAGPNKVKINELKIKTPILLRCIMFLQQRPDQTCFGLGKGSKSSGQLEAGGGSLLMSFAEKI